MEGQMTARRTLGHGGPAARLLMERGPVVDDGERKLAPFWRDAVLLFSLLLFAGGLRVWQIAKAEVASRDSIGFIRMAWQCAQRPIQGWGDVIRQGEQHPGYPLATLAVKRLVGAALPQPESVAWQLSAQIASGVFGVLLVIPVYLLGRELFDRRVAFGSCLLFQCLPAGSRVLGDGLSEAMFLFFAAASWLVLLRAFRKPASWRFALGGVAGGGAYLVRPEGAVLVAATLLVLLGVQAIRARRRPWPEVLRCTAALLLGAGLVGGPFVAITGKLTTKPSSSQALDPNAPIKRFVFPHENAAAALPDEQRPLLTASILASWSDATASNGLAWGAKAIGFEFMKGTFFVLWAPALVGAFWFRDRFREPAVWPPLLACGVILMLLWRVAWLMGYVSDRHLLLPILFSGYWAVAAILALPERVKLFGKRTWLPMAALLGLAATGLARSLEPLHADRAGFKAAGLWIAERVTENDVVLDPYCWSHYYAGQLFRETPPRDFPPGTKRLRYVVLEKSNNAHAHLLPYVEESRAWAKVGTLVHSVAAPRSKDKFAAVEVYTVPIPFPPQP
jgi:hypothetical protein